jgi:hypothetical protein
MPSYGPRTNHLERWAIVEYVRSLSGAAPAPAAAPVTAPTTAPATEPGPAPAPATGEQ